MRNENIESICRGTLGIAKFSKNLNNAHNCFHFNYIIYNTFSKTGTGNFDDTITDHKQHNIHSRIIKLSSKTVNTIIMPSEFMGWLIIFLMTETWFDICLIVNTMLM